MDGIHAATSRVENQAQVVSYLSLSMLEFLFNKLALEAGFWIWPHFVVLLKVDLEASF